MYKVTRTNKSVFGDEKFSHDYRGFTAKPTETKEETLARFDRLKKKCVHKFRVLDDDGEIYFWGVATTNDDERAFAPLDYLGVLYGATEIQYKNNGKWETL